MVGMRIHERGMTSLSDRVKVGRACARDNGEWKANPGISRVTPSTNTVVYSEGILTFPSPTDNLDL